ncbi:hypothetical protein [Caulobacter sp. LARHSG274]
MTLPKDVTLRDLRTTLIDQKTFVAKALHVLRRELKNRPDVCLRLGITGGGKAPNYRVETGDEILFPIDGANHERWEEGFGFNEPGNWSQRTMSFLEVEQLLREIRQLA